MVPRTIRRSPIVGLLIALLACTVATACGSDVSTTSEQITASVVPAPAVDVPAGTARSATAVFAGGCFWGVQGVFQHVDGVLDAVAGYTGGTRDTAQYSEVSNGTTGHAESVRVTFDPSVVSYGKLLQIFFAVVTDPTTLNAQGPDRGTQYRSEIFATTPAQHDVAERYIRQLGDTRVFSSPIVTTVSTLEQFYPAESYHQNFMNDHPDSPYIAVNDAPKLAALQRAFPHEYRSTPS